MINAVVYARYSSSSQTEQSIEGQVRVCTAYAAAKGLSVSEVYADRAISGRTDQRPEFQRLLRDADRGKFAAVIVYRTDRFARNKYDSTIYKARLKKAGIAIHYAAECIPDGPEGVILESLMEGLAEYYSLELAQKIKRGMVETARKGKTTGGRPPLGYRISADKRFEIDPATAPIVRRVFEQFRAGKTRTEICAELNTLGVRTGSGTAFNKSSLRTLLSNEKYIGVYRCKETRLPGAVPAIIPDDLFYAVQSRVSQSKHLPKRKAREIAYPLSGKLFCGYCNSPMTGVSGTSKTGNVYGYYYCRDQRRRAGCTKKAVAKDKLEITVTTLTMTYVLDPAVREYIISKCVEIYESKSAQKEELALLRRKITSNVKATQNVITAIENGVDSPALTARLASLESECTELKAQELTLSRVGPEITPATLRRKLQELSARIDSAECRSQILGSFVHAVYLWDDKLVIIYNILDERSAYRQTQHENIKIDELCQKESSSIAQFEKER